MRAHHRNPGPQSGAGPALNLIAPVEDHVPRALTACSVCLCVLRGTDWVEAETVIRELRSFEVSAAPRLSSALCHRCARSVRERRARPVEPLAA